LPCEHQPDELFESRLAELKGATLSQRRRDGRRGSVDDSPEARRRENERLEAAAEFAAAKTDQSDSGDLGRSGCRAVSYPTPVPVVLRVCAQLIVLSGDR
jgi:hypothetical protein